MTLTKLVLTFSIAVAGCKGGSAPSCDEAITNAAKVAPKLKDKSAMDAAIAACKGDKWSDEMRTCVGSIKSEDDAIACMSGGGGKEHKHSGGNSEAAMELNAIGKVQKRNFGETSSFTVGNAAFLPSGANPKSGCCGLKGGTESTPGTEVKNKCPATPSAFKADPQWNGMGFSVEEESAYGYSYVGTSATSFTAYAIGDADCDGNPATFTLQGTIDAAGNPSVNLIKPPAGVY